MCLQAAHFRASHLLKLSVLRPNIGLCDTQCLLTFASIDGWIARRFSEFRILRFKS